MQSEDGERAAEFERQRKYLERSISTLKKKVFRHRTNTPPSLLHSHFLFNNFRILLDVCVAEATGLGFVCCCFLCVLLTNRDDFGLFLFHILSPPPPQADQVDYRAKSDVGRRTLENSDLISELNMLRRENRCVGGRGI